MRFKLFFIIPIAIGIISTTSLQARPGYEAPWGKDADLQLPSSNPSETLSSQKSPLIYLAEKTIRFHQEILSPVDGPRSHFRPSSSQYTLLAIRKYGFFKGFALGCDRLLRENDASWVYKTIEEDGKLIKYNPVP